MWLGVAAVSGAIAVLAGAFGAHGLRARLTPEQLASWTTASAPRPNGDDLLEDRAVAHPRVVGRALLTRVVGMSPYVRPWGLALWAAGARIGAGPREVVVAALRARVSAGAYT